MSYGGYGDGFVVKIHDPASPRLPGDADGSGKVDADDAKTLAANWGQSGDWSTGDFNNDGLINALDAAILAAHWGYNANAEATAIPEPSVLAMLALCLVFVVGGRRRRVR